jgi:O-antigen/teichoic acid export membrane protein
MTELKTAGAASNPSGRVQPRMIRNVLANWGGYLFNIAITFFLSPFVVHHLGDSLYGIWVLIVSVTGYLGLLDMGVRGAVTRYISKFHAESNHRDANRTASSAIVIFAGFGLVAIGIAVVVAFTLLDRLHIPAEYQHAARIVLMISGFTVATSLLSGVFGGIIVALHRFDLTNLVEMVGAVLRSSTIVFILLHGGGLISLAVIQLGSALLIGIAYATLAFRLYPELHPGLIDADRDHFKLIFSFSIYSFVLSIFTYLILYTDSIVIAAVLPISFVTFFSIASNLITYSRGLLSGITSTMTPLASRLEAEGKMDELRRVVLVTSRTASGLMFPVLLTLLIRGKTFIGLWMGAEYAELSGHILWILCIYQFMGPGTSVAWAVLMGVSKHKKLVPMYLAESFSNLALSIILAKKIGVVGVAWGTTIPSLAINLFFWPWYMKRALGIAPGKWAAYAWIQPLGAMLPFAICTYVIDRYWPVHHLVTFFSQVALACIVAFFGFWYWCLNAAERGNYLGRAKQTFGWSSGAPA